MNVNDIPKELYSKIKNSFESNKDVRLLRTAQQNAERTGDYMKALHIAQQIDNLWTICLDSYMEKAENEAKQVDSFTMDMPDKDKDEMMKYIMVCFMAADLIESAVNDMNDVLHRTKPNVDIATFNDIRGLSDLAKSKLKYLQESGDYMKDLIWADKCDNMYDMVKSKAMSIIRKRKNNKDYGKNGERLSR